MKISEKGLNLIREFEGCRLTAYKPVAAERYYTIGYGHYGADVHAGMRITQSQADAYLEKDVAKFVASVNALGRNWTQNQFDALVSFTMEEPFPALSAEEKQSMIYLLNQTKYIHIRISH